MANLIMSLPVCNTVSLPAEASSVIPPITITTNANEPIARERKFMSLTM